MATTTSRLRRGTRLTRIVCLSCVLLCLFAISLPAQAQPVDTPDISPDVLIHSFTPADYPADPPRDIPWSSDYNDLSDVIAAFNSARSTENALLGTFIKPMVAPSEVAWAAMSEGERALWLINEERTARGLAPLQGLETNVNEVAQAYAEWLLANNEFDHEADGKTPWQRLDAKPAIAACHDTLNIAENLYWQGTTSADGIPLVIEQAVYSLIYVDATSEWGHRHAILWTPYTENSGAADREGFLGLGHARGGFTNPDDGKFFAYTDMIVMNFFDPCATWVAAPPVLVPEPPTPEPIATPKPPPLTHSASGSTSLPAWKTITYQPFEANTWPGAWEVSDANGSTNGDYRWIAASCNVFDGEYSGMAAGGGVDGLPLACGDDYPNNARSWMVYGPFSLEQAVGAILQAKIWVYTETDNDMLCMMLSTDGDRYNGTCFSGYSNGWVEEQLDLGYVYRLGSLLGRSNLYVAFAFLTNASVTRPHGGAFVDDITLNQAVMEPGTALYGVEITSESGQTAITDQNGNYTLTGLSAGKHTLTPSKLGYEFHPATFVVDVSGGDVAQISFIGTPDILLSALPYSIHLPLLNNE